MRTIALLMLAALAATGCSRVTHTAYQVATSKNREAALKQALTNQGEAYARNPQAIVHDARQVKGEFDRVFAFLTGRVEEKWGKKEVKLPSKTHYVKYTQNYMSRAEVDFDAGLITVETVHEADPEGSLRSAIVTTLLTPSDPRSVDLFSDKGVELSSDRTPYLHGLVLDRRGKPIAAPPEAEAFADEVLSRDARTREVELESGRKTARFVRIPMVANFSHKQAEKYRPAVTRNAAKYGVSASLVYAIIKTESNFNPFAVSSAPAFGLMQLVPTSGGREAHKHARGVDEPPSKQLLFDPDANIELGTAYLSVLNRRHLEAIANPTAREYCVISAYNTGPSNVLRAFSKERDRARAVNAINAMQPPAVYEKLRADLPHEETRQYLVKVTTARRLFVSAAAAEKPDTSM